MQKVLFRVDASHTIGTGHIHRTLVLAQKFHQYGYHVEYACQDLLGNMIPYIKDKGFYVHILPDSSEITLTKLILTHSYDLIAIDHYDIDAAYEKTIKQQTGIAILSLDDMNQKHCCDYILNQNFYADSKAYTSDCSVKKIFCGSEYALLRDEFFTVREIKHSNASRFNILLTMGGSDPKHYTLELMEILHQLPSNYHTNIIVGSSNPKHIEIKALCEQFPDRFTFILNTSQMAELINESDFIISACGSTVLELLYLKKNFLAIVTADNQEMIAAYLKKNHLATTLKDLRKISLDFLLKLFHQASTPSLPTIAIKDATLEIVCDMNNITLRNGTKDDSDFLFTLANDQTVRDASLNSRPISRSEHNHWFDTKLRDPNYHIYLLCCDAIPVAALRTHTKGHFTTLSIAVDKVHRGKKYANILLSLYFQSPIQGSHLALVKRNNIASNRLFQSNRFRLSKQGEYLNFYTRRVNENS